MRAYRRRVHEAVTLGAGGLSIKEIAERLSLPNKKVEAYLHHMR